MALYCFDRDCFVSVSVLGFVDDAEASMAYLTFEEVFVLNISLSCSQEHHFVRL
jgi:hypothetical protein